MSERPTQFPAHGGPSNHGFLSLRGAGRACPDEIHPRLLSLHQAVGAPTFLSASISAQTHADKNVGAPPLGSWLPCALRQSPRRPLKTSLPRPFWLGSVLALLAGVTPGWAAANVPPTAVILSAVQRPGTTFMDIDFRVNDPDDATVETAALGFVNGGTSFPDIVKISTLVEGTAAHLGSNTPANTTLRLTWNVAADWNTNFGQVQVEILAKDSRALLPFHWITLPASGTNPAVTINDRGIYDADLLPIWYWLIAKSDPGLQLVNGQVLGVGGDYNSLVLATGTATVAFGREFLWERLDIRYVTGGELTRARSGRYGFQSADGYSIAKGFRIADLTYGWGYNTSGQASSFRRQNISAVAVGRDYTLILSGGIVFGFGNNTVPASAINVTAIAAGNWHSLALRADGTVIVWGANNFGQTNIPASAINVTAIAAGYWHSFALRRDGTVIGWGDTTYVGDTIPASATNVTAIAAGGHHNLVLRADRTVTGWGWNAHGQANIPASATNVIAIAAGYAHSLALRADGTVIGWGNNDYGQVTIPASATNVTAIAGGFYHSLALRADGTVVAWGRNTEGQLNVPAGLSGIDLLGVGCMAYHVVVVDKRTP